VGNSFASDKELLVLTLLRDAPKGLYGLELVKESGDRLKRGTVYVTLARLEDKGLIRSRTPATTGGHSGLPRPHYTLTAEGRKALDAAALMGWDLARSEA
jgi:DNA-binding PadR family transcriptional regulator